jgi:sec-independent protein translocase protein TatC
MALVPFPAKGAKPALTEDSEPDWDDHDKDPDPEGGGKMSFLDHLDELRRRIVYSLIGVGIGFVVAFVYIDDLFGFIVRPMQLMLPAGQTMIYTDPAEAFFLKIKIALMAGVIGASPIVFSQVWLFIAPGLYVHEKKLAIPFIVMSSVFFAAGAAFSHYVVFPIVWLFFAAQATDFLTFTPRVEPSFSMYLRLILALGLTFELPTIVLFMARMGLVTAGFMIRHIKYAALIIVIAAAILSPDGGGVGMLAMGGPVFVLYLFSIGLAWLFGKRRRKPEAETA